jgi:hypothetical protein
MKDILSIIQQFVIRSRCRLFCDGMRRSNDPGSWIEEFRLLSGRGHSNGWRFNRFEVHER